MTIRNWGCSCDDHYVRTVVGREQYTLADGLLEFCCIRFVL